MVETFGLRFLRRCKSTASTPSPRSVQRSAGACSAVRGDTGPRNTRTWKSQGCPGNLVRDSKRSGLETIADMLEG